MAVEDALACLPGETDFGSLSADNTTCTFANDVTVTFNQPLAFPSVGSPRWNFTIAKGGRDCLHFEDYGTGSKLVVAGNTVVESVRGGVGVAITCPDGVTYTKANASDLLNCADDAGFIELGGGLPGDTYALTPLDLNFGLLGTSSPGGEQQLFDCFVAH